MALSPLFEREWGLSVLNFKIADFDLDEEDVKAMEQVVIDAEIKAKQDAEEIKSEAKLEKYLKELERLDDKQWEREKYLSNLQMHDKVAYYEVLKVIGNNDNKEKSINKCPHCGLEHDSTAIFCAHCGKRVSKAPISCPDCGKVNSFDATFCSHCGKKLL